MYSRSTTARRRSTCTTYRTRVSTSLAVSPLIDAFQDQEIMEMLKKIEIGIYNLLSTCEMLPQGAGMEDGLQGMGSFPQMPRLY